MPAKKKETMAMMSASSLRSFREFHLNGRNEDCNEDDDEKKITAAIMSASRFQKAVRRTSIAQIPPEKKSPSLVCSVYTHMNTSKED